MNLDPTQAILDRNFSVNPRALFHMRTTNAPEIAAQSGLMLLMLCALPDNSTASAHLLTDAKLRSELARQQTAIRQDAHHIDFQESMKQFAYSNRVQLSGKLRGYATLPRGWDGYGGHAPTQEDIENAIWFMSHIPDHALFSARLMVAGDGDVGFRWEEKDRYLEIGFSDGDISFYGESPGGKSGKGEEVFSGAVHPELQELMLLVFAG